MINLILVLTTIISTIFLSFIENIEIATKVVFIIINAILLALTICNFIYTKIKSKKIAKAIRFSSGGFRYIQAGPAEIKEKGFVQVTMNIKDFKKNPIYRVFETVKMEAKRYGVNVFFESFL